MVFEYVWVWVCPPPPLPELPVEGVWDCDVVVTEFCVVVLVAAEALVVVGVEVVVEAVTPDTFVLSDMPVVHDMAVRVLGPTNPYPVESGSPDETIP